MDDITTTEGRLSLNFFKEFMEGLADELSGGNRLAAFLRKLNDEPNAGFKRFYIEELLGRSSESGVVASEMIFDRWQAIIDCINTDEFAHRHCKALMEAFPHLKRKFFIHVYKSGGTTIFKSIEKSGRYATTLTPNAVLDGWTPDRIKYLREIAFWLCKPECEAVTVFGHHSARWLISQNIKRGQDEVFTVMRHPLDTMISYLNFILTSVDGDEQNLAIDKWREELGLSGRIQGREHALELAPKILSMHIGSNLACELLGVSPDFLGAKEGAAILGVQFILFEDVDKFIASQGLPAIPRQNVSRLFLKAADLPSSIVDTIYGKIGEDLKLYSWAKRYATKI